MKTEKLEKSGKVLNRKPVYSSVKLNLPTSRHIFFTPLRPAPHFRPCILYSGAVIPKRVANLSYFCLFVHLFAYKFILFPGHNSEVQFDRNKVKNYQILSIPDVEVLFQSTYSIFPSNRYSIRGIYIYIYTRTY